MSEAATQVLIPAMALVGIGFALLQWFLVSRVQVADGSDASNRYEDRLIEEQEEGVDNLEVVIKCAEIQNAISLGKSPAISLRLCFCI